MRLVVDTNVLVSAFLWQGTPGRRIVELFTSRALIDELSEVLHRQKLAKQVEATGLTAVQMVRHYSRRLAKVVPAGKLANRASRDVADDAVLACALTASANLVVSGDNTKAFPSSPPLKLFSALRPTEVVVRVQRHRSHPQRPARQARRRSCRALRATCWPSSGAGDRQREIPRFGMKRLVRDDRRVCRASA